MIIHDSQRLAMASLAKNVQLASLVVEIEALAATQAIELAAKIGLDTINFLRRFHHNHQRLHGSGVKLCSLWLPNKRGK